MFSEMPSNVWLSGIIGGMLVCCGVLMTSLSINANPSEASNNYVIWSMNTALAILLLYIIGRLMPDIVSPQNIKWQHVIGYFFALAGLYLILKKWQ